MTHMFVSCVRYRFPSNAHPKEEKMFTAIARSAPLFARAVPRRAFSSSSGGAGVLPSVISSALLVGAGGYFLMTQQEEKEQKLIDRINDLQATQAANEKKLLDRIDDIQVMLSGKTNRYASADHASFENKI